MSVFHDCGILTSREIDITEAKDATALLAEIHSGKYTAIEATTAFCKRAVIAHQLVNCLMDIDIDGALRRARELDGVFSKGTIVGPLHGLPVSLKVRACWEARRRD